MHIRILVLATFAICGLAGSASAVDPSDLVTLADGLENPTGVAIQPGTGDVFVAERPGIVRFTIRNNGDVKRTVEISKFPTDQYGKGPIYDIGPLGLAFASSEYLIVGDGSQQDVNELIRIYRVDGNPPSVPLSADSAVLSLGPLASTEELKAEGNYYGVAYSRKNRAIYATANGDDTKGWIVRSVQGADDIPQKLERFLATKEAVEVDAPVAITLNKDDDLVVGQMGEINIPSDSLLSIYDAKTGKLKANYETGLFDITGLAYGPDGTLYATDFAWMDTTQGALYTLTISGDECVAEKVIDLDKPTALAFGENGDLYVTVMGTVKEGDATPPGKLLRIAKDKLGD
ncbi:MAG: hypothetical protein KF861_06210 [Planctomycetaceae bacterium]|nr:hypothetical protein [Planctomycetaceae bacterium]